MNQEPDLEDVSTRALVGELLARGWKVCWMHGKDPLNGNLELEGPEQNLKYNSVDAALEQIDMENK